MMLPDLDLQESSKSTILSDECSGRVHPKDARKPNNNRQGALLGCAVSKWKTRSGVLEKLTRDRRWISSVQFWYAKKAKEINGGSLSWPLQDACATSCPSLEDLLHDLSGPSPRDQQSAATRPGLE